MLKLKILYHNKKCRLEQHGNWIDCKSAIDVEYKKNDFNLIPLGFSMKLPKYYEANLVARSSTFIKYSVTQHNALGVIDGPSKNDDGYSGNGDEWKFGAIAHKKNSIKEGDRICQFKIIPTMNAPWYVKLHWLFFGSKIKFIEVDDLEFEDRGGFGSTN